jgi:transposase
MVRNNRPIVKELNLKTIPHHTTLQKAADRISIQLLRKLLASFITTLKTSKKIIAGVDATGFQEDQATSFYTKRVKLRHSYLKLSLGSDMITQLACSFIIQYYPLSHEIKHFPKLFEKMRKIVDMKAMILDKGYDSEDNHVLIRKFKIKSVIAVRDMTDKISKMTGKHRILMKKYFNQKLYNKRNITETIFSVTKRTMGSMIKSHNRHMETKELVFRIIAYNCHRTVDLIHDPKFKNITMDTFRIQS